MSEVPLYPKTLKQVLVVSSAGVNMREWVRTRAQLSLDSRKVNLLPTPSS